MKQWANSAWGISEQGVFWSPSPLKLLKLPWPRFDKRDIKQSFLTVFDDFTLWNYHLDKSCPVYPLPYWIRWEKEQKWRIRFSEFLSQIGTACFLTHFLIWTVGGIAWGETWPACFPNKYLVIPSYYSPLVSKPY